MISETTPRRLRAVGLFYRDFAPVTDGEVGSLLRKAAAELGLVR